MWRGAELRLYRCGSENPSDVSNVKTLQSTKGKDMATATGKQIERVPNAINLLFLLPLFLLSLPLPLSLTVCLSLLVPVERFL